MHSSHLTHVFRTPENREAVKKAIKILKRAHAYKEFDVIAMSGMSSIGVVMPVAYKTGLPIMLVRKPEEKSHGWTVEMSELRGLKHINYCFVDDFISSGDTIHRIEKTVTEFFTKDYIEIKSAKLVCIYTYMNSYYKSLFDNRVPVKHIS